MPVAWLSLDADDNAPAHFISYLVAALDRVRPGTGAQVAALLRSPETPPLDTLLISLLADVESRSDPLALALDDYHVITDHSIHAALSFVLEPSAPLVYTW